MANKTKKRVGIIVAMVALLVAICAVAGTTLARYISSVTVDSQSATVAQWGYTISADASELFGSKYNKGTIVTSEDGGIDVKGTSDALVVAPGTQGSMTITFNGTAEVDAELTIDVTAFTTVVLAKTTPASTDYYPLKWKVGSTDVTTTGTNDNQTLASQIATELTGKLGTGVTATANGTKITAKIPAGTSVTSGTLTIGWSWELGETTATETNNKDTLLGYLAASKTYDDIKGVQNLNGEGKLLTSEEDFTAYKTNSVTTVSLGLSISFVQTQNS